MKSTNQENTLSILFPEMGMTIQWGEYNGSQQILILLMGRLYILTCENRFKYRMLCALPLKDLNICLKQRRSLALGVTSVSVLQWGN